jgi:hypothetical protein
MISVTKYTPSPFDSIYELDDGFETISLTSDEVQSLYWQLHALLFPTVTVVNGAGNGDNIVSPAKNNT